MIIFLFFMILLISVQITNKKNEAQNSAEVLDFGRKDSLFIIMFLALAIIINMVRGYLPKYNIVMVVYSGVFLMTMVILNKSREVKIKKKQQDIISVFEALSEIFGRVDVSNIDFENIPFEIEYDSKTGIVSNIVIDMSIEGGRFNENSIISAQYDINKRMPQFQWLSNADFPKRKLEFKGLQKPPTIAMYPGSDYRPTGWIPLGLSGEGEIGWNLSNPEDKGSSSYILDNGAIPKTVKLPSAPQALTLGSTGGGKSIYTDQRIDIRKRPRK